MWLISPHVNQNKWLIFPQAIQMWLISPHETYQNKWLISPLDVRKKKVVDFPT
jgi:hypothetical protein